MKMIFWHNNMRGSYFYKIFMFFIIVIVLIFSISFIYYYKLKSSLIEDVTYKSNNAVNTISGLIEKELREIEKTFSLMTLDLEKSVNPRLKLEYNEFLKAEHENILIVWERLKRQESIKQSIDNAAIYFILNDCILTKDGAFQFNDYFSKYYNYLNVDMEKLKSIDRNTPYVNILGQVEVEKLIVDKKIRTRVIPIIFSYFSYKNFYTSIMVNLKEEYLLDLLNSNKYSNGNRFVIADPQGNIVCSSDNEFNGSFRMFFEESSNIENGRELVIDNNKYFIFRSNINFANWSVFSFIPEQDFMEKTRNVMGAIILSNTVLLLAGLIIAFYFSGKLYSPIANLFNLLMDTPNQENKSGKINEIDFISGKLSTLKKTNIELLGRINKYGSYVQENIMRNIILYEDNSIEESEILELFKTERIKLDKKIFILISFRLIYSPEFASDFTKEEQDRMKKGINIVLKEGTLRRFEESLYIEISQENFLILVNTDDENIEAQICSFIEKMNEIFKEDTKYIKMLVCISDRVTSIFSLPEVFRKSQEVMENSDINNAKCILEKENCIRSLDTDLPKNFDNRLDNILKSGNYSGMDILLREVFEAFFERGRTVAALKRLSALLADKFAKEAMRYNFSYNNEEMESIEKRIEDWNFEGVRRGYLNLFNKMAEYVSGQCLEDDIEAKKKLFEEYFEKNYCNENTCLESMAAELNFNTNYLSRKVKEVIGKSFSEYLTYLRMEKAMELLENSDLPVDSIASKVGVASRATFNRQFKKYTSVSPAVYRAIKRR